MTQQPMTGPGKLFELEYPQSVAVYDSYPSAQKAVDYLADQNFPVANLAIVGTDLRLVERVTGRRTWGTVLLSGVQSGLSTGLIIAIIMWVLNPGNDFFATAFLALSIGVIIGVLFAVLGYAMSRGRRDFTSVTQTVATKYELLCEHKVVAQARQLLTGMPGVQVSQLQPPVGQPYQPPHGSQPPTGPYPYQQYPPYPQQPTPDQYPQYPGYYQAPPSAPQQEQEPPRGE